MMLVMAVSYCWREKQSILIYTQHCREP